MAKKTDTETNKDILREDMLPAGEACPEGEEMSLEEAFAGLEELTRSLEDDGLTLEESFNAYKKGMDLLRLCSSRIDRVEKKVLVLNEEGGLDEF